MSKFRTPTNVGRIDKMISIVGLLAASAGSNKATDEELAELFEPLLVQLRSLNLLDAAPARLDTTAPARGGCSAPPAPTHKPSNWATIHDMAQNAPLADLTTAMAVFLNRLDEELNQ